jgi:hypothetical protein
MADGEVEHYRALPLPRGVSLAEELRIVHDRCTRFLMLEDHARQIASDTALAESSVLQHLEALRARGALLSFEQSARAAACSPEVPPITSVVFPTRDRVEMAERAARALVQSAEKHGRAPEVVILDGSSAPEVRRAYREMVEGLRKQTRLRIAYAGFEEKLAYILRLSATAHVEPRIAKVGLLGSDESTFGAGANRNVMLLGGTGQLMLSVDDDVVCRSFFARFPEPGMSFEGEQDCIEFSCYRDRTSALAAVVESDCDVLAEHEKMLGRPLGSLLDGQHGTGLTGTNGACAHMLLSLKHGTGTVRLTQTGIVGDSGMDSGFVLLGHNGGATHAQLTGSEEAYRMAFGTREMSRGVRRFTVSHGGPFVATAFGLDNRGLLPPFLPVLRNEDGVFGAVGHLCIPESYTGHVPLYLLHDPPALRTVPARAYLEAASHVRMSEVMVACMLQGLPVIQGRTQAGERLRAMGDHLSSVAKRPGIEFERAVRQAVAGVAQRQAARLQRALDRFAGVPDFWARDVRKAIVRLSERAHGEAGWLPIDIPGTPEEVAAGLRSRIADYGALLGAWPALAEAARDLHRRGGWSPWS